MKKNRNALISVNDKKGLGRLCNVLVSFNIGLISTGSTAKEIKRLGFKCKTVYSLTKFHEILDGRVKTLHPKIHASILFNRKEKSHIKKFDSLNFPTIDFLFVNLYPFEKIAKTNSTDTKCIELIDIGGPALLRSAAKNYDSVTSICKIIYYKEFINNISTNNGITSLDFRKKMAAKVFDLTSKYDKNIFNWLNKKNKYSKNFVKLKYGENPNQNSSYYFSDNKNNLLDSKLNGKEIGYNNILDLDAGINCINEFKEPTCVIIKHTNPCSVASCETISKSFKKALDANPISAFGGVVIFNKIIDNKLAETLNKNFFELIAAKDFTKDAINILSKKKRLILIKTKKLKINNWDETKFVIGGILKQEKNNIKINIRDFKLVSQYAASSKKLNDLIFAYKVCKHVKSNAIVLVKNKITIGIGAGQMSRLDSTKISLKKINKKTNNFVVASDAFFPFTDSLKLLEKKGCKSIIQPKGSINDNKLIDYANKKKLSLYFTNYRLFKH